MAITTDRQITVHGVTFGVSKPIQTLIANGDFTFDELSKFAIVGRHDFVNNVAGVFEPDTYSYMAGTSAAISELEKYPVLNSPTAPSWDSVLYTYFGSGNRSYDNYGKMVLVYNMVSSANTIGRNFNDNNEACIVTEFNPRLIKMLCTIYTGNVVATVGDAGTYTTYDPEGSRSFAWVDDDTSAPFASMCIQNFGDAVYFDFPLYNNIFNVQQNISGNRDSTYVTLNHIFDDYSSTGNKLLSVWCDGGIDDFLVGANYGDSFVGVHDMSDDRGDKILNVRYVPYGAECSVKSSSLDTALKQLAGCGFYFEVDGTVYKPITDGGIVTGYTADLTKNSQWDLINDVTGNTIPDTPTGGGGDGDVDNIETDIPLAYIGSLAGMVNYIKIWSSSSDSNLATADDIAAALSRFDITTIGKDLLRNFIAFKVFATLNISDSVTRQITVDGHGLTDENNNPLNGTYIGGVSPIDFTIGKPEKLFDDFRDYAPYTKIECYVPFCGWFTVPSWCIGRTITGTMFTDVYNGTCKCTIFADKTPVAEIGGCIAYDIPFVADATGAKAGAVISSALSTAAATAATIAVPNVATGITAASSLANTICALNSNDTTLKGVMGDGSNLNGVLHCLLKVTRPQTPTGNKAIPNAYKHEFGIPCNKELTLTAGMGFTQINDAVIEGSMTDREKQMIVDGFRHGLIL